MLFAAYYVHRMKILTQENLDIKFRAHLKVCKAFCTVVEVLKCTVEAYIKCITWLHNPSLPGLVESI